MQSGTFDFKHAGSYTETLTIDASSAAARQLQQPATTPAPPATIGLKAAGTSTASIRPATASCLKSNFVGPNSSTNGTAPEHAGRAVSFAADVLKPAGAHEECCKRPGKYRTSQLLQAGVGRETYVIVLLHVVMCYSEGTVWSYIFLWLLPTSSHTQRQLLLSCPCRFCWDVQQSRITQNRRQSFGLPFH